MPIGHDYDERIEVPPWEEVPWGMPIQISLNDVEKQGKEQRKEPKAQKQESIEPNKVPQAKAKQESGQQVEAKQTSEPEKLTPEQIAKKKAKKTIKEKIKLGRLKSKYVTLPKSVKVPKAASDLVVITKTKDLVAYIFLITKESPKKFRATFVSRLQNLGLDVIENLYCANECVLTKTNLTQYEQRKNYQARAKLKLRMLEYFALLAYEAECIQPKHYEQIAKQGTNCQILLANWVTSDAKRVS